VGGIGISGSAGRLAAAAAAALLSLGLASVNAFAYNCDLSGPDAPSVDTIGPTGNSVSTGSQVVVSFTAPMVEPSVVVSVQPAAPGVVTWLNDHTLRFQPAGLAHGVSYAVTIRGRAVGGALIRGPRSWRFTTDSGPPLVLAPGQSDVRVPILMYHYIRINPDPRDGLGYRLSVTPADFAAQMDWLAANGYHTVTMRDLVQYLSGVRGLPSKPVVLTFDDGYADFYTAALPILASHEFTGVSYVVSNFIGKPRYMTASQVMAAADAGIEIGSHTVGHVDLTGQPPGWLSYQLSVSKKSLESLLGRPVVSFCYPFGRFGAREMAAVAAAGYLDATTTVGGTWHSMRDRYAWTRVRISGGESLADFAASVQAGSY